MHPEASPACRSPEAASAPRTVSLHRAVAAPAGSSTIAAAAMHIAPGARTGWHTHPPGQTIFVTEGVGLCQGELSESAASASAPINRSVPRRLRRLAGRRLTA
ncbi:MAG: hypothetical protein LC777_03560 [Actinobacteria bacterium]|nr:hypothetical protein [Actinomycetota bacterium]